MKPILETIQPNPGNSFFYSCANYGATGPFWHIHPEYEIVYIKNGSAEQHVGSHFSRYENGTLLMIGPNIPHSNMGNYDKEDNIAVVIQMSPEFMEKKIASFSELCMINELLKRSQHGIQFSPNIHHQTGTLLEAMATLEPHERLMSLIRVMCMLASTNEFKILNAHTVNIDQQHTAYYRVNQITRFVTENYQRNIQLTEIAKITGLTESSFSRFFRKITGKTFISFLNEYRVHQACILLADNCNNISEIMYKTGFNEAAHFTRVFKKNTGYSPSDYRKNIFKSSKVYSAIIE